MNFNLSFWFSPDSTEYIVAGALLYVFFLVYFTFCVYIIIEREIQGGIWKCQLPARVIFWLETVKRLPPLDFNVSPRHGNTELVSSGVSLTLRWEGASLALVGDPSSDGVAIKMPYGVDLLHRSALHPIFSYWVR